MAAETPLVESFGGTWSHEQALRLVGLGLEDSARIFQDAGVRMGIHDIVDHLTDDVMRQLATKGVPFRPGARELLASLRAAGIKTGLVTMSLRRMAGTVVDLIDFEAFDVVIAGDDSTRPKPFPDPYLQACAALGVVSARHRRDRGLAERPALRGRLGCRRDRRAAHGLDRRRRCARGLADARGPHRRGRRRFHSAHVNSGQNRGRGENPMTVERPSGPFRIGDRVQLTGPKGRLHTITLREDGELHTHHGVLRHTALIGQPDGSVVTNSGGHEYLALRPLLRDFVMSMPRGAAIVYPKDAAQIIAQADVFPGSVVVEAGVGSGALALSLLRAIGDDGRLVSFERRAEFADVARANVETFLGRVPENWSVVVGDLVEELPDAVAPASVDRVVLDMLAPWECIDVVADALHARGSRALLRRDGDPAQPRRGVHPRDGALHRTRRERDDGARLARRGTRRPSRPSHGGAHRLPGVGATPGTGRRSARAAPARIEVELRRRGRRAVDARRGGRSSDHRQEPPQAGARGGAGRRTAPGPRRTARTPTTISGSSSSAGSAGPWHLDCSGAQDPRFPRGPRTRRRRTRRLFPSRFERVRSRLMTPTRPSCRA